MADASVPADHLVFVVHGIGASEESDFKKSVACLEKHANEQRVRLANLHARGTPAHKVKFVPIWWWDAVHTHEREMQAAAITPQFDNWDSVAARSFARTSAVDVLMYMYEGPRLQILDVVAKRINDAYHTSTETPKGVSFIGHSLGSVVLFDLLSSRGDSQDNIPVLEIPDTCPRHLFLALGSPIGIFLHVRQQAQGTPTPHPGLTVQRFMSVFHPWDPIAYRLEPILHPNAGFRQPQPVAPHVPGKGAVAGVADDQAEDPGRVDFIVPASLVDLPSIRLKGIPVASLPIFRIIAAHLCYWESKAVARHLIVTLAGLQAVNQP